MKRSYHILKFSLTIILLLMAGCGDNHSSHEGLEAVYDSERFKLSLSRQRLSIYDRDSERTIFSAHANDLLQAHITELQFPQQQGNFQERTVHSCSQAVIEKAEPYSAYFLLVGHFQSPNCKLRFYLRFSVNKENIQITAYSNNENYNHLTLGFSSSSDETIYGFGAQVSTQNFKGAEIPIWIQPQGIGRGEQPISTIVDYYSLGSSGNQFSSPLTIPYFLSTDRYSLYLENSEASRFDFSQTDRTFIHSYSPSLKLRLSSCSELISCVTQFGLAGQQTSTLPDWIFQGAVIGLHGGTEKVLKNYQTLKQNGAPISALIIHDQTTDTDTSDNLQPAPHWHWDSDSSRYPDWDQLIATLRTDNVKVIGYISPILFDSREGNSLYQYARDNHFFIQRTKGDTAQLIPAATLDNGLIDLSNPKAFNWLKLIIKQNIKERHYSGWIADFGETLPADADLPNSLDPLSYHHHYVQQWARLNREVLSELPDRDQQTFMMRSGYGEAATAVPVYWLDHQNTSWSSYDGLQSAVIGQLNSGLSGIPINHSEIGGYSSMLREIPITADLLIPNELVYRGNNGNDTRPHFALRRKRNLLKRWVEMSAFSPLFRTTEGATPEINTQIYDHKSVQHFAYFAKLFAALYPYRKHLLEQMHTQGLPLIRHPILHYPNDKRFLQMADNEVQFMLGDSIMVAPKLTPRNEKEHRQILLPEGEWLDFWSREVLHVPKEGVSFKVTPPIGQPPFFLLNNETTRTLILPALYDAELFPLYEKSSENQSAAPNEILDEGASTLSSDQESL